MNFACLRAETKSGQSYAFFSMRVKKNLFKHIIIGPNVLHRIEYGGVYIRVSKDVADHDDLLYKWVNSAQIYF